MRRPSRGPRPFATVFAQRQVRSAPPFRRVLVANRGEIAIRIIRACRELGIESVAVYSDADARAMHVRAADRSVLIGPPPPAAESYLRADRIIQAALDTGAEAIHPGYGFLSEQAAVRRGVHCRRASPSLGPVRRRSHRWATSWRRAARPPRSAFPSPPERSSRSPSTIATTPATGSLRPPKRSAIRCWSRRRPVGEGAACAASTRPRNWPRPSPPPRARPPPRSATAPCTWSATWKGRATSRCSSSAMRWAPSWRSGERDCSIQRRHQKLVEEAPAPGLSTEQRRSLHALAVSVARTVGLRNAATAEFLMDRDGRPAFLEVNARLQVEHGVTELVDRPGPGARAALHRRRATR